MTDRVDPGSGKGKLPCRSRNDDLCRCCATMGIGYRDRIGGRGKTRGQGRSLCIAPGIGVWGGSASGISRSCAIGCTKAAYIRGTADAGYKQCWLINVEGYSISTAIGIRYQYIVTACREIRKYTAGIAVGSVQYIGLGPGAAGGGYRGSYRSSVTQGIGITHRGCKSTVCIDDIETGGSTTTAGSGNEACRIEARWQS